MKPIMEKVINMEFVVVSNILWSESIQQRSLLLNGLSTLQFCQGHIAEDWHIDECVFIMSHACLERIHPLWLPELKDSICEILVTKTGLDPRQLSLYTNKFVKQPFTQNGQVGWVVYCLVKNYWWLWIDVVFADDDQMELGYHGECRDNYLRSWLSSVHQVKRNICGN